MSELSCAAWPFERLPEAIEALARRAGLAPSSHRTVTPLTFPETMTEDQLDRALVQISAHLGVESEAVDARGAQLEKFLRSGGPAVVRFTQTTTTGLLLLLSAAGRTVRLLGPDLAVVRLPLASVRAALCADAEKPVSAEIESLLRETALNERQRAKVTSRLVRERLAGERFAACWLLRMPPGAGLWKQIRDAGILRRLLLMLGAFIGLYVMEVAGWTLLGRGALNGRVDPAWLGAWALLLIGAVPLHLAGSALQATLATDASVLMKQRLLAGALSMNIHDVRRQGAGHLLSRVLESEALESLILSGGFAALLAMIELLLSLWVLAHGAGGGWHVLLLLAWLTVAGAIGSRYYRHIGHWTRCRLDLTHDLVERMVGHRTRMVQKAETHIHEDEDERLERYVATSRDFDRAFVPLAAALPRGWLIVGLLGLAPAFIAGKVEPTSLAIALGGILLANRALGSVAVGLAATLRAAVAAQEIAPLLAASNTEPARESRISTCGTAEPGSVLLQARDLVFRQGAQVVLDRCDLTVRRGERLLLEGSSGGGKSTLAALLVGLNRQDSGLLLLDGLDRTTRGDAWRTLSTAAPQFHENHVLSGSLAFNLLMGRRWPATPSDLAEAEALCRELGLGELLDRMPSGLMQTVGETGWQLSHGERSRVYLARALLQEAELVILDESFASLDPATLDRCLRSALARAKTLLVIAHP